MIERIAGELADTVEAAAAKLRSLSVEAVSTRPAADRWTIKEVIGHLVDSAANNHQRFVRAQFTSELVFPKYEQNEWVRCQHYDEVPWPELVDLWVRYNRHLAHVVRHVPPAALETPCKIGDYKPVSLGFLIEDYLVHLRHHLQKIAERVAASA